MIKTRYEIDPDNRLVIIGSGRMTSLPRYRRIVDGRFKVADGNVLTYLVRSPQQYASAVPHEIKLRGAWSLTRDHGLKITLEKSAPDSSRDELIIGGSIIDAGKNSLRFAVTTKYRDGVRTTYVLDLAGVWHADNHNRLTFRVNKSYGSPDILTFEGAWEVNKDNELIYRYEHRKGLRRARSIQTVVFRGYWNITNRAALTYTLDAGTNSAFNFKVGLGAFRGDRMEYEVGMGYSNKLRPRVKTIAIYGRWKIAPASGLSFEIEAADGSVYSISFAAQASLNDKDTVLFRLKTGTTMRDLGITLEISRKILGGDGEAFLRYLYNHEECAVLIGATRRW